MSVKLLKTGIQGFDKILGGGLPQGDTILLAGPVGSYAELFGLEFIYRGALKGEKTIYVSFEKSEDDLIETAGIFGWKLKEQIKAKNIQVMDVELFNYETFISTLEDQIFSYKTTRVLFDSITFLGGFFENKFKYRTSLGDLRKMLNRHECTSLLVSEAIGDKLSPNGIEEFIVDGIIHLQTMQKKGQVLHAVTIPEMKGMKVSSNLFPIELGKTGLRVRDLPLIL